MASVAVVLMSGGMDSCVTAAVARRDGFRVAGLHVNYGQRTEARERQAFDEVCAALAITDRLTVDIGYLKTIGGSSLTDPNRPVSAADLAATGIPSSYVPFRNGNLLAMAASWAEVLGARAIYVGAVEEDSSGYPDCRESFYVAYEAAIREGTKPDTDLRIVTPLIHLKKAEIVRLGLDLAAPLERTWSCYQAEAEACGVCDSCALRLRGFAQAGVTDPIPYAVRPTY